MKLVVYIEIKEPSKIGLGDFVADDFRDRVRAFFKKEILPRFSNKVVVDDQNLFIQKKGDLLRWFYKITVLSTKCDGGDDLCEWERKTAESGFIYEEILDDDGELGVLCLD